MSLRKKLATLAMLVPLLGGLAAPAAAVAQEAPKKLVKWKHGLIKLTTAAGIEKMALEKEFFKKYGVDMEYQEFISAPLMTQALSSGALDSVESNPMSALLANSKGGNLRVIGSTMPGLDFAIYARKDITKVADLQGKRIGTSAALDLPDLVMRAIFMKEGLPFNNAIYAAVGGNADRVNALAAGSVDADVNSLDMLPVVEANPNLHMLMVASDVVPDFPRLVVLANANTLKDKPREAVVGVLAGMMEGMKYATEHKDEALKLSAKAMGVQATDPRIERYYNLAMERHFVTPKMEAQNKRINYLQDFAVEMKMIPAKLPEDKLIDMSYRDEAYKLVYGNQ